MSKYVIEDTTLTSIADAVREKAGTTELIKVSELPDAIAAIESGGGGEEYFTDEELVFTGDCTSLFANDRWSNVLEKEKGRISINAPTLLNSCFNGCTGSDYSDISIIGGTTVTAATYLFANMRNLTKLPTISNLYINGNQSGSFFSGCQYLNDINIPIYFFSNINISNQMMQTSSFFASCHSFRNLNEVMPYIKTAYANHKHMFNYSSLFFGCYTLDEIKNIPVFEDVSAATYNRMSSMFSSCSRIKNAAFETNEDGSAKIANWKSQTLDMSSYIGHASGPVWIINYNSGITADKRVTDDTTYQVLKDDPDWWTTDSNYSRYNHDSAVNTINSLPDTSAYLATAGGTNTIKFIGAAGALTDGGAINTLTEEEIAVAASKGWTVTLV